MTAPLILFACVHNSGRSVAARVLTEHYAAGRVDARSAGSEPGNEINPQVAAVLAERGLSTAAETPKLLDTELVRAADVVVTMGCGETCPIFPGKRYEDWAVDDPKDQDPDTVRRIVDQIDNRVRALLAELNVPLA
jgi:arsenate reductase (thioredoxin)